MYHAAVVFWSHERKKAEYAAVEYSHFQNKKLSLRAMRDFQNFRS